MIWAMDPTSPFTLRLAQKQEKRHAAPRLDHQAANDALHEEGATPPDGWTGRPSLGYSGTKSGRNCPTEKVDDKEWDKNQKKVRQISTGIKVVVPLAGIEPALLAELDFESSASTNSAIGAQAGRPGWARTIRLEACSSTGQFGVVNSGHVAFARPRPFDFVKRRPLCGAKNLSRQAAH